MEKNYTGKTKIKIGIKVGTQYTNISAVPLLPKEGMEKEKRKT